MLALAGFLALYYGAAAGLFVACMPLAHEKEREKEDDNAPGAPPRIKALRAALLFAALWTLAELARGTLLTGFPWGAGGYAHVDGPFAPLARWVGVYGIGFVAAWLMAFIALYAMQKHDGEEATQVALLVLGLVSWTWWLNQESQTATANPLPPMQVALLQGNIPQDEKFVPGTGVIDALRWYGQELREARATLVIAPETAIPVLPQQLPDGYWQGLLRRYGAAREGQSAQAALIGVPLGNASEGYTNSVMGLAPGQSAAYRYDKHHLVPFGEFIPPLFKWFVQLMNIPLGDFNRGALAQPSFAWQAQRLAPNICYEDLFGEELAARFGDPAAAPTAFVNLSNIGWFGDGVAIDQHLAISRMRAREFERPMLRATNTGATAIINAHGQVTHLQPRTTRGVLTGEFEGHTHLTPYAVWTARWRLWPLWAACAALALLCASWRKRHGR